MLYYIRDQTPTCLCTTYNFLTNAMVIMVEIVIIVKMAIMVELEMVIMVEKVTVEMVIMVE